MQAIFVTPKAQCHTKGIKVYAISETECHTQQMKTDERFSPIVTVAAIQQTLDCVLLLSGDNLQNLLPGHYSTT